MAILTPIAEAKRGLPARAGPIRFRCGAFRHVCKRCYNVVSMQKTEYVLVQSELEKSDFRLGYSEVLYSETFAFLEQPGTSHHIPEF